MSDRPRVLVLGGRQPHDVRLGWHLNELQQAAVRQNTELTFADYESLHSQISCGVPVNAIRGRSIDAFEVRTAVDDPENFCLSKFDAILTRTMPAGSFERITFRLATLHDEYHARGRNGNAASMINPPSGLELAIDKYATLARASQLGIPVPPTRVVQSRAEALDAFADLGGDVVVKPIFGGEGRGVMRIRDAELAWTAFSALEQVGAVFYLQRFLPPGGADVRLLVLGGHIHAIRRTSVDDFRTNVKAGGKSELIELNRDWASTARSICDELKLPFAAVDLIETNDGQDYFLVEVNAIPGWKSAQAVLPFNVSDEIMSLLLLSTQRS